MTAVQREVEAILENDPARRDLVRHLRENGHHLAAVQAVVWAWQEHHAQPGPYGPGSRTFPPPPAELREAAKQAAARPKGSARASAKKSRSPSDKSSSATTVPEPETKNDENVEKVEYAALMEPVARRLLGDPNPTLTKGAELRFGTHGSLAVDTDKGRWFSHEDNEGGGVLDLVRRELERQRDSADNAELIDPHEWLRREGFIAEGTPQGGKLGPIVATYDYRDEQGELLFQVCRFDQPKKDFRQRRPQRPDDLSKDIKSGWVWKTADVRKVVYRLPDLLKRPEDAVFIVEGEKDADRLWSLDLVATCNPGGASKSTDRPKWTADLSPPFKGRTVYILPDNDEVGRKHALAIAAHLVEVAKEVRVINLPNLDNKGDVSDWLDAGNDVSQLIEICRSAPIFEKPKTESLPLHFHGEEPTAPTRWLIRHLLPETGVAILSGQWGTFKTFEALDIAASVMTGISPRESQPVYRRSGVLFVAAEGAGDLPLRLAALSEKKIVPALLQMGSADRPPVNSTDLPFCWTTGCPPLLDKKAINPAVLEKLIATAHAAAAHLGEKHALPLGLIVIDTMAAVAGWTDENDNAQAALVMDVLRRLSDATGALVLVVDHFGKEEHTGTRGASAKEAAADAVLAMLGEKQVDGSVTNTRLAIRKQRGGPSGEVFHFEARVVEMGVDEQGFPLTSRIIDWMSGPRSRGEPKLSPAQRVFLDAFVAVRNQHGRDVRIKGKEFKVASQEAVQQEFLQRYDAENPETKRRTFWRVLRELRDRRLMEKDRFGGRGNDEGEEILYDPDATEM